MKILVFSALLVVLATVSADYTGKFEDFDVPKLFADEERLQGIVNCVLEKGSCTEEAQSIKDVIMEAAADKCAHCSVKQLQIIQQIYSDMVKKDQELVSLIIQKLDPADALSAFYKKV
uniref:Chemosensory protein n=1 Tax=Histia rhodope TaxID=1453155 RepID=A0A6M9BNH3_9NEOP|nr:chemosensory protein [Histia rhodope]